MELNKLLQALEVDTPAVLARFCNNEELLQKFICKFPSEKTFGELKAAHAEGRLADEAEAAHTLKGIAANFGFDRLYRCSMELVDDLRGQREATDDRFAEVCTEYKRLTDCIDDFACTRQ